MQEYLTTLLKSSYLLINYLIYNIITIIHRRIEMDPNVWFPIIVMGMVVFVIVVFGILVYLDKGE
jgi:phenylacetate-coenzyme A ligase PaaK-like adenylate-forming protein